MLLLLPLAFGGVPFRLPPGEDPRLWVPAFELGDFEPGGPESTVELVAGPQMWELRVHDGRGGVRSATVPAPVDMRGREDVILLASSLLRPLTPRDPWVVKAPEPEPVPEDLVLHLPRASWGGVETPPEMPTVGEASSLRVVWPTLRLIWEERPGVSLDQRVVWRPGSEPALAVGIEGSTQVAPGAVISVQLRWQGSATLQARPTARLGALSQELGLWWVPGRLRLGLQAGIAERWLSDSGLFIGVFPVGVVGVGAGVALPLRSGVVLLPQTAVRLDLAQGDIAQGTEQIAEIFPLEFTAGLAIQLRLHGWGDPFLSPGAP
ncbi:MAG TPA: hypothetical protein PLA94_03980 [Myxococcota bacterium]|nr:hypothetical protein [Myxococcota bacterium]